MTSESLSPGQLYPQEAELCAKKNCFFLAPVGKKFFCQPGRSADQSNFPSDSVQSQVRMYRDQYPSSGCTRQLDLSLIHWRKHADPALEQTSKK